MFEKMSKWIRSICDRVQAGGKALSERIRDLSDRAKAGGRVLLDRIRSLFHRVWAGCRTLPGRIRSRSDREQTGGETPPGGVRSFMARVFPRGKMMAWPVMRILVAVLICAIILLNLFTHVLQVVHYNGDSMEPTLRSGQVLVLRRTRNVSEGDIISFYYNNQVLVRRVMAVSGRQITVEQDGRVRRDGEILTEPYVTEFTRGQCNISFPFRVSNGYVFVMGDNRKISMDSRLEEIGPVSTGRIIGKLWLAL